MKPSLCSVVIPVYNGAKYLQKTLTSCLAQEVECEIILVEDASTDASLEILYEYQRNYPEIIRIVQHEHNEGFVRGVMDGVATAQGKYVSVLGQDDVMVKERVSCLLQMMMESGASMVCSNAFYLFGDQPSHQLVRPDWNTSGFIPRGAFLFQNPVVGSSVIFKKDAFKKINFTNLTFRNSIEWYHWFNYACMDGVYFLAEPLIYYRKHETNISHTLFQSGEYRRYKRFCRKYMLSKLHPCEIALAVRNKILKIPPTIKNSL
ncbi:MAG: glycosyltransferase [Anaerolineales bacterium]|nr:glycosyltransferase [Anaerolineales bacterium]